MMVGAMTPISFRFVLLAAAGLLVVACESRTRTSAQWIHSARSNQEQAADRSECRSRANFQTEREVQREGPFMSEERVEVQRMFDRDDATRRLNELYDNCMRDKGYAPLVLER